MTLLTICQDAIQEFGEFEVPSQIVGNTNETAAQLLALAKREVRTLSRTAHWQRLTFEHTFATTGVASYALPSDFDYIENETVWDRTDNEPMQGPQTAEQWQTLQGSSVVTSIVLRWRIFGNLFYVFPSSDTGTTVAYEYISRHPVESSGGTGQATWAADADVGRLDEDLLTMGVKWRFLKAKGVAYQDELNEYIDETEKVIARDGGKQRLRLDRASLVDGLSVNIPEGDFTL